MRPTCLAGHCQERAHGTQHQLVQLHCRFDNRLMCSLSIGREGLLRGTGKRRYRVRGQREAAGGEVVGVRAVFVLMHAASWPTSGFSILTVLLVRPEQQAIWC
jgi:hypothetical protein